MIVRNTKAEAVLAVMRDMFTLPGNWHCEPYLNGRECGFQIFSDEAKRSCVFAEYRNTDQIVVYDFDSEWNQPWMDVPLDKREASYNAKKFFKHNDYTGAAEFIYNKLKGKES